MTSRPSTSSSIASISSTTTAEKPPEEVTKDYDKVYDENDNGDDDNENDEDSEDQIFMSFSFIAGKGRDLFEDFHIVNQV